MKLKEDFIEMKIICSYCGAEIEDSLPKCPFCDTLIPQGAEADYMEKLYDIQEDMEELKDVPSEIMKTEIKHQGKRMKKVILITLCAAAVLAVLFAWNERQYDRNHTADYIWEHEMFPIMSELYENEKYDELEEMYYAALMDDKSVWNWEYYEAFSRILESEMEESRVEE